MGQYAAPKDFDAVQAVLDMYCTAGARGDIPAVQKIFHETAVMNGCRAGADEVVLGPIDALWALYEEVGPAPETEVHADVLDIAGDIAVGRIVIKNWHGRDFVDYHELMRIDGEWKIVAKIYCQTN